MNSQIDVYQVSEEENLEAKVMQEAESTSFIEDDNEDVHDAFESPSELTAFNRKYKINPRVKQKPELRKQGILLSVRNLKQFFFFGKGIHKQKLKAVSNVSFDL